MAKSRGTKTLDVVWLGFSLVNIFVMIFNDLPPLFPALSRYPIFATSPEYYVKLTGDRFFLPGAPAWFVAYHWLELFINLPLGIYLAWAIWRSSPNLPAALLAHGAFVSTTTFTCTVDMLNWEDFPADKRNLLIWMYGPYLLLSLVMTADGWIRSSTAAKDASIWKRTALQSRKAK